jgi:anti-sigma B factor antagonist
MDEKGGNMIIDCQDLKYIDSTGLGVLISALRRVKDHDGTITIRGLKPYIQKIFGITGLDKIFSLEV